MKSIISLFFIGVAHLSIYAQVEGVIHYQEMIKLDVDLEIIPESLRGLIPKSQNFEKEMLFNSDESLYKSKADGNPKDLAMETEDGSISIKISHDDVEDIYYISNKDNQVVHQQGIMGKSFIIESELEKYAWKITNEKIKYLDYECQKAIIESEDTFIVAWYTSQIPVQVGPRSYNGLPGAILMLSEDDGAFEIKATKVNLSALEDNVIKTPTDGKKVTKEKFEKIREEKLKEMEQTFGGGNVKSIRR